MGAGDQQGRSDSAAFAQVMKLYRDNGFDPIVWPGTSSVDLDVVFRRPDPPVLLHAVVGFEDVPSLGVCLEVEGAKEQLIASRA